MMARLVKTYYFADSLGSLFLSNKKVSANGSSKATKKLIICVEYKQFIQHFFFLNSTRQT